MFVCYVCLFLICRTPQENHRLMIQMGVTYIHAIGLKVFNSKKKLSKAYKSIYT